MTVDAGVPGADQSETGIPGSVERVLEAAAERKALDVVALDLRGISSATDWFIVASGTSDIHVRAIADFVERHLREVGERADHVEGREGGRWVLLDYIDFVVHVFHQPAREFYQLETLWGDAPRHEFLER